jgi:hypothetical protein
MRCSLCGDPERENTQLHRSLNVCFACITDLIDNEVERRGVAEQERRFTQHWEGHPTQADGDRQDLKDAGRYRG